MQPAHQQAQPEMLPMQPPVSAQHVPAAKPSQAQRAGWCRWVAAVASALALASLSVAKSPFSPEWAFGLPAKVGIEECPMDILRGQLQTHLPEAQRFAVHVSLGRVFVGEGRLADAVTHFNEAVVLAQSHAEHAESRRLLALAYQRQARLSAGRELLKAAMAFADEDTEGDLRHALADIRAEMGHFEAAIKLYNRAFDLVGKHDADKAALLAAHIGEAWAGKGQLQVGLNWLRTAADALEVVRWSPAEADETIVAKVNARLGAVHHRLGNVSLAMGLYRKALRAQALLLHSSHPDLVSTQLGLAGAQRDLGNVAGALHDVDVIEKVLRTEPQEGLELSRVLIFKSDILRALNHTGMAERTVQEAIRLQNARLQGDEHPEVAVALSSYGSILRDSGRPGEALDKYIKALEISVSTVGEEHPMSAAAYNSLGTLYQDLGDDGAASEHFSKCLDIQLEILGKENPDVAKTYNNLATVLSRQGREQEAATLLEQALQVLDHAGVPHDNPDRVLYPEISGIALSKP